MPEQTKTTSEALNFAKQVEQKAIYVLEPMRVLMDGLNYPKDLKLLMWEAIGRKALTYAARNT